MVTITDMYNDVSNQLQWHVIAKIPLDTICFGWYSNALNHDSLFDVTFKRITGCSLNIEAF